ncbi:MAG: hypothetical protein M1434_13595 [Chloroflexi bacterium]|nr:hypothetical protein [Chloroflexota bacterium]MCL5275757.1 hypothetical protein [Chloroflexota bacterium]
MTTSLVPLAAMGWPWKSEDPAIHIILVSDQQFTNLADHPDEAIEKIFPQDPEPISLREHCRRGAERGASKLLVAYDYFFGGSRRSLYPDTPAFQNTLKKINDVAAEFGLSLEPSILSPLELGVGYKEKTGESGRWMHYREGLRDPQTGAYTVMMWQHTRWCNNKGPTPVKLIGARAFAFHEERIPGTPYFAVKPADMVELPTPVIEPMPGATAQVGELPGGVSRADTMFQATRVRVHGSGGPQALNRVLVVLLYETVEMDYFSPAAPAFMDDLIRQYHTRNISLAGIYSDEMHIQQDWSYHNHFDNGQFNLRYVSPGFEKAFAAQFSSEYGEGVADFARYLLYFASNQHDFLPTHEPKLPSQHVLGSTIEDIRFTMQLRRDYFSFLESGVVNLMNDSRHKLEQLIGHELDLYYHATWAESPTCDAIAPGGVHDSWSPAEHRSRYEYTPDFLWSNTVHQASAACANYFQWNEFLTGGNNDVPEGGYADRDYYARALACSLAALNRRPLASAGMWGFPPEVGERMLAVSQVYGALGHPVFRSVQDYAPRSIEVLFLYPQDLVAVDERFGSWMSLYGYANTITAEKLVEYGHPTDAGHMAVKDNQYNTICVQYEPFPSAALLTLLKKFVESGGNLIWSSVPPLRITADGLDTRRWMEDVFGAQVIASADPLGMPLPGRQVQFEGVFASIPAQSILTDFVVDRVFAVEETGAAEPVASIRTGGPAGKIRAGVRKVHAKGGQAVYLGFRPRDDQSASTGTEQRTWFEILNKLGAYPGSNREDNPLGAVENDNPTVLSRGGDMLACAFPNGALAVCPHFKDYPENWTGGFFRDADEDRRIIEQNPLPDDRIDLREWRIAGQTVNYQGRHAVVWRCDGRGGLLAFAGYACTGIEVCGTAYRWSEQPVNIGWHPLAPSQRTERYQPLYRLWCGNTGIVTFPLPELSGDGLELWLGAHVPWGNRARKAAYGRAGYGERPVPFEITETGLCVNIDDEISGHWLYLVKPARQ